MKLDDSFRETLVDELDDMLDAYGTQPDSEPVVEFLLEQLEIYADDYGIDDIVTTLEESGELEAPLQETLEGEMASNDEFEYTGEEIVSLLERVCHIEWDSIDEVEDDDDLDDLED